MTSAAAPLLYAPPHGPPFSRSLLGGTLEQLSTLPTLLASVDDLLHVPVMPKNGGDRWVLVSTHLSRLEGK